MPACTPSLLRDIGKYSSRSLQRYSTELSFEELALLRGVFHMDLALLGDVDALQTEIIAAELDALPLL